MQAPLLNDRTYTILFSLLGIVYVIGLFVPLMDNDSAHHAVIALHMYLKGDPVSLIDHGKDYLDKPHLHFWLAAGAYKVFGVTTFAYKFPSFLATLLGTWSTFRLGRALYGRETGRLAALITASAFAYILANNDVRMDALLTAFVALGLWQGVEWVQRREWRYAVGLALGLALGFATKGHIAVFTVGVGILAYILGRKDWKALYHPHLVLVIGAFFLFIAPVVYCYYLQYDLHPEKVVRGKSGRSGVAFILWTQNTERFEGEAFGSDAKNDYLFFVHSFLWAFAPWSLLAFGALVVRVKSLINRPNHPRDQTGNPSESPSEWLTPGVIIVLALMLTFSGFKLPHYLNIIFPAAGVLTAAFILERRDQMKFGKTWLTVQIVLCMLVLLVALVLNFWAFPVRDFRPVAGAVLLIAAAVVLLRGMQDRVARLVSLSVLTSVVAFFFLNTNFYPQLLTYQGGGELARTAERRVDPDRVYFWPGIYSSSYNFYTSTLRREWNDSLRQAPGPIWIMTSDAKMPEIRAAGLTVYERISHRDHEITQLRPKFLNPGTRPHTLGRQMLVRVK